MSPTSASAIPTPPPSAWRALAAQLRGDLIRPGDSDYFESKELFNPRWDHYRPVAVIEAANTQDVAETIRFARRYALRIRPKAGGHSYVGASSGDGVIVVSTGRMSAVRYDAGTSTALVGAGAKLYPVHRVLASHGRTIPTGTCPTVGAAGLALGGGIGIASRSAGLTCDQLESARIVTADGVIRTASGSDNPDLHWALRGCGGGNFGIVTQLALRTQPTAALGFFLMTFPWARAVAVVRGWSRRVRLMPQHSWANLHLEAASDGTATARVVGVCTAGHESSEAQAMQAAIGVDATSTSLFTKTYLEGVQFLGGGTTSPRQGWAAGSDVLPHMTAEVGTALVRVIANRAAAHRSGVAILDPLTGAVSSRLPGSTAFPWRRHLCTVQWYVGMPDHPSGQELHAAYDWIDACHRSVASVSSGGYVNYVEPRRSVASYYGPNFARLRAIRRQYDPDNLFSTPWSIPR